MRFFEKHRFLRKLVRLLLVFLLLPYLLSIIYIIVPPVSTLMLWGWMTGAKVQRQWVPLEQMSPALIAATLTAEDDAFCDHFGMNFTQLKKSVEKAQRRDEPVRATSTITMQVAKNLFFWQGRSWIRKILEMPMTFWLELIWSKERILEAYLNVAQMGYGVYGAEAAAKTHFGTTAKALNYPQAVLLVTSLPNPNQRLASNPSAGHYLLAQHLLKRLQKGRPDMSCIR